jgi:hypothetical protein
MKRLVLAAVLIGVPTWAQQHDHTAEVNARGEHVMGFSQEKTTHHFRLTYDGGEIDVRANDVKDTAGRDEIRTHFRHIAQMFASGDFRDPMAVHATDVPGTAVMKQRKDELHWELMETPRGAKLVATADSKPALDALHEFLRFQIADHKTRDCPIPH